MLRPLAIFTVVLLYVCIDICLHRLINIQIHYYASLSSFIRGLVLCVRNPRLLLRLSAVRVGAVQESDRTTPLRGTLTCQPFNGTMLQYSIRTIAMSRLGGTSRGSC